MVDSPGFEPFINPAKITDRMVRDLYEMAMRLEAARTEFLANPSPHTTAELLDVQWRLNGLVDAQIQASMTLPVMVHVAGERQWQPDPDSNELQQLVQSCARCGSHLVIFNPGRSVALTAAGPRVLEPDDFNWYPLGTRVAKVSDSDGTEGAWPLDDLHSDETPRALEPWEHECIGSDIPVLGESNEQE